MSCGVACVFIIFICQNGLLQVSNAEEDATTPVPTTQEPSGSDPSTQEPTTLNLPVAQPFAQNSTAQNSSAPEILATDAPKQDKLEIDPPAPESNTKELPKVVGAESPTKQVEDETKITSKTVEAHSDTAKEDARKVTSSDEPSSTDMSPTASKLTKETTTIVNEPNKPHEEKPGAIEDVEKVTQETKAIDKGEKDEVLSTIAPPKGVLDLGLLGSILPKGKPIRRTPNFADVRNDIVNVVSRTVDSAKDFAGDAYNSMKSAVANVFNR